MARFTSIGMPRKTFVSSTAEETHAAQEDSTKPDNTAGPSSGADEGAPKKKTHRSGKRLKAKLQRQAAVAAGEMPAPVPTAPKVREEGDERKKNKKRKTDGERDGGDGGYGGPVGQAGQGWGRDPSIAKKSRFTEDRAEHRRVQRIEEKKAALTCFACRGTGHSARDCPNAGAEGSGNICYRCGSTAHSLKDCRKPINSSDPTPFASCYVCSSKGHLSSQCPENAKGVYVKGNGGKCKICGSVRHLVADCPELAAKRDAALAAADAERQQAVEGEKRNLGADEDDWMAESRVKIAAGEVGQQQKRKSKSSSGAGMEKKPFNNNGLRRPYKEGELVGRETEGFAEGVEGKPIKQKMAKVVAF